jgi:WD40 repeat protein
VLNLIVLLLSTAVLIGGDLPRERIVYTTVRPANWELYLFDHGAVSKQVTNDPALDYDPTFSPDGRWVVFCSERSEVRSFIPLIWTIPIHQGR